MASSWLSSLASGGMKAMSHFTSSSSSNSINTAAVASQGDQEAFVVDDEGYQIRRYQLASLRGVTWVNDQVINYYFHLIQRQFPDVTSLGSHLYAKLAAGDMAGALRWVRRRDIFSSRVILIAINLNNAHWTLAVVDMEMRKLSYYDSLQGEGSYDVVLQRIAGFMDQAYAAKHDGRLPDESFATWPRSTDPNLRAKYYDNLPRQSNNNDCGVFVTQFGLCAACGIAPDFTQQDITLLRNVIMLELSQKKMLKRIHR
ncbi:ubiquitin-like protease family member (Ulp-1), putative [Bodo saltans]|uniref:Ubiquitin-like protease family member (Ulp-1), putative n=1 Tax=Bodo saltans TaxID=75058 RepID=A0A0S4JNV0_BODSA|nr:ubiquitin-like protease family member (Ulp-1), putative [Bodo saltans]|eukprot:CUG90184.1 ubiquitin-like protease family member (Ulp-1), putative [Bodo saltans]